MLAANHGELEKELALPEPIYNPGHLSEMSETEFPRDLECWSLGFPNLDLEKAVFGMVDGTL
ncbi:hypothetical protein MMC18_005428 [Xylographa bjoerkii]|nr:hypothetical protein [Xylographa bjoerkii]